MNVRHRGGVRMGAAALVVLGLVGLAACGSDDDGDKTTGSTQAPSAPSGDVRGVSATEIRVGGLGDSAGFFTEQTVGLGAQARFARANREGEIPGGRKITMAAWGDIKADTATGVQEMRRLIDSERVFAIVPNVSAFTPVDPAQRDHVPVFGFGISPDAYCQDGDTGYFFGFDGCVVPPKPTTAADNLKEIKAAAIAEGFGTKDEPLKFAVISPDNTTGKRAVALFAAAAKGNGMEVVYAKAPTPAPPAVVGDYSPFVRDVLAKDPDIVFSVGVTPDYIGLGKALRAANFKGMYVVPAADPLLAGLVGPSYAQTNWATPEQAATVPSVQQLIDDVEAFKPGTKVGTTITIGWLAADHFIAALQEAGKNLTAESLQKAAAHMTYERRGHIGPTPYPKNYAGAFPACHAVLKTDGSTYEVIRPYSCSDERFPLKTYDDVKTG